MFRHIQKNVSVRYLVNMVYWIHILNVGEKLPVSEFRYFGKYILQIYGCFTVHVSVQRHTDLEL